MIEVLRNRRSIRRYTDKKIEQGKIEILKEALLRSPSSRNFNPWEFIFVDDPGLLEKLAGAKPHGAAFLKSAPLGIVVLGDETKSDVWVEDCSIASMLVQLVGQTLGLGSCWIQIRNRQHDENQSAEEYIQNLLAIPENMKVESIIAIGYPAEKLEGVPFEKLDESKISVNKY